MKILYLRYDYSDFNNINFDSFTIPHLKANEFQLLSFSMIIIQLLY